MDNNDYITTQIKRYVTQNFIVEPVLDVQLTYLSTGARGWRLGAGQPENYINQESRYGHCVTLQ